MKIIRRYRTSAALMAEIADEFSKIELNYESKKPRIGIVGEIYVRSHPFANGNIIARLEELGAACDLVLCRRMDLLYQLYAEEQCRPQR